MMTNRQMIAHELEAYEGAVNGFVLDSDDYESRLYVAAPLSSSEQWYLYGDLRPAFDIDDDCKLDEHGTFGNHTVARILQESDIDLDGIVLDPEGSTFFAYAKTGERATKLAEDINKLSEQQRLRV